MKWPKSVEKVENEVGKVRITKTFIPAHDGPLDPPVHLPCESQGSVTLEVASMCHHQTFHMGCVPPLVCLPLGIHRYLSPGYTQPKCDVTKLGGA